MSSLPKPIGQTWESVEAWDYRNFCGVKVSKLRLVNYIITWICLIQQFEDFTESRSCDILIALSICSLY